MVEDFQERCREILKGLKDEKQEAFSWDDVGKSEEMGEVNLESIVGMASYFESLQKRVEWFVTIINSHLAPADVEREGQAGRQLAAHRGSLPGLRRRLVRRDT